MLALLPVWGNPSSVHAEGELIASLYCTPHHLNPAIQSGLATAFPGAQIFAGLVRFDNQWNPHPYLVEKWKISKDGLTVTFIQQSSKAISELQNEIPK